MREDGRTFAQALEAAEYLLTWNILTNPEDIGGQFEVAVQILLMKQDHKMTKQEALERANMAITLAYDGGQ